MLNSRDVKLLHWKVQELIPILVKNCAKRGVYFKIISTVRDEEYQLSLWNQGRVTDGSIVTNSKRPSFHWDKVGLAFDICVTTNGKLDWDAIDKFKIVGEEAKKLGFTYGGDWGSIKDYPHIQLDGGLKASDIWNGKRPKWFYDSPQEKISPIKLLVDKNIISSSEYWTYPRGVYEGKYCKILLVNFYKYATKKYSFTFTEVIDYLVTNRIISDKNYWLENCKEGQFVKAEHMKVVIERISKLL